MRAQLTADLSAGAGMALGLTAIAALPLGGLGLINFVEMVRGRALELPWGAYGVVAAVVPGSYFVAGFLGALAFFLLRPLRASLVGWIFTGFTLGVTTYGTIGVALAVFYDPVGKLFLDHSTQAEAWRMARLAPWLGLPGAAGGGWQWWKARRQADAPAHVTAEAALGQSTSPSGSIPSRASRRSWRPSVRDTLTIILVLFLGWARYSARAHSADGSSATVNQAAVSPIPITQGVNARTDVFARSFIELLRAHSLDSAAHLMSPTAHIPDSLVFVRELATRIPSHAAPDQLERTLALTTAHDGVTRGLMAYAIRTPEDSQSVVLQTVEELGVQWIERADVKQGVVRTLAGAMAKPNDR